MHNPPPYQAFGYFLISFMKDVEGNFFAMYEKQLIKIQLPFKVSQKLETHEELSASIVSGEPVLCSLYPRTDIDSNLMYCRVVSVKPYKRKSVDNFFTIKGKVVYVNDEEQKLAIKICVTEKSKLKLPFYINMIYSQPLTDIQPGDRWDIKAELKNGKLKVISGELVEKRIKNTERIKVTKTIISEHQAYANLVISISKDEEGNFYALHEKQVITTTLATKALIELEEQIKQVPSILSGEKLLCGLYARTDTESQLKCFNIIDIKPYDGKPINSVFSMKGNVTSVNADEQKIVIRIYANSRSKKPFSIHLIYPQPILGLEVDQIWQIKAELKDGKLTVISGTFVENYIKKDKAGLTSTDVEVVQELSDNINEIIDTPGILTSETTKETSKASQDVEVFLSQATEEHDDNIGEFVETKKTNKTKKASKVSTDAEVIAEQFVEENQDNKIVETVDTQKTKKTKKTSKAPADVEVISEQVVDGNQDSKIVEVVDTAKTTKTKTTKKAKKDVEVASEKVPQKSRNNEIIAIIKPAKVEVTPEPVVEWEKAESVRTAGKLEITIKISELPDVKTVENGLQQFELECDGKIVSVTLKPKVWKKLTDAQTNYPMWVASVTGKIGQATSNGFVLVEPNVQTFEKKPKEPKAEAASGVA